MRLWDYILVLLLLAGFLFVFGALFARPGRTAATEPSDRVHYSEMGIRWE